MVCDRNCSGRNSLVADHVGSTGCCRVTLRFANGSTPTQKNCRSILNSFAFIFFNKSAFFFRWFSAGAAYLMLNVPLCSFFFSRVFGHFMCVVPININFHFSIAFRILCTVFQVLVVHSFLYSLSSFAMNFVEVSSFVLRTVDSSSCPFLKNVTKR